MHGLPMMKESHTNFLPSHKKKCCLTSRGEGGGGGEKTTEENLSSWLSMALVRLECPRFNIRMTSDYTVSHVTVSNLSHDWKGYDQERVYRKPIILPNRTEARVCVLITSRIQKLQSTSQGLQRLMHKALGNSE